MIPLSEIKKRIVNIWGEQYDFSLITEQNYNGTRGKYNVICNECGCTFSIRMGHLLDGHGCKCRRLQSGHYKKGKILANGRKLVYGKGINDAQVCDTGSDTYKKWFMMLRRCYEKGYNDKHHTYRDCYVCDEWLRYSNFKKWMENPENGYVNGYHLDKDILVKNNKVYSPDTCCFVPQEVNHLFMRSFKKKQYCNPRGIHYRRGHYEVNICTNGKITYIGSAKTKEEAFAIYKKARERKIYECATLYFDKKLITEKVFKGLSEYEININDKL